MSPDLLVALLLYQVADGGRRGYRELLDAFWDDAQRAGFELPTERSVSAPGFCKARRKLSPALIRRLLGRVITASAAQCTASHRFKRRRVFAVDGCKVNTQRSPELAAAFGIPVGGYCPQALVTVLHDVLANVPQDAVVSAYHESEREHFLALLPNLRAGDIVVLDRGFPSYELLRALAKAEVDYVIRVTTTGGFAAVEDFLASGREDARVLLGAGTRPADQAVEVRAVRRDGPGGEAQVFVTSLRRYHFTANEIRYLYGLRWQVELLFRENKGDVIGHGQFHAKTALGVEQEVLALLLFHALSRNLMATAAAVHGVPECELSHKTAIYAFASRFVHLVLVARAGIAEAALACVLERIARRLHPKRPNRSFPRRSFKPASRWCATGKRGG